MGASKGHHRNFIELLGIESKVADGDTNWQPYLKLMAMDSHLSPLNMRGKETR
jgi:hypothetical protein